MKCFECLFKHLAGALSYGKQIMSGHGEGADLDHRIDFLGELVNAEHHAELIDKDLATEMKTFRSGLQGRGLMIDETTLEVLRQLYLKAQGLQNANKDDDKKIVIPPDQRKNLFPDKLRNDEKYSIVIDKVNDLEKFELAYKLIKANCLNDHEIYVLNPEIEIKDIPVLTGKLYDNLDKLTENFIYMKQNYLLIKKFDFNTMQPVFTQQEASNSDKLKLGKFCYSYDSGCPQVLNKSVYKDVMKGDNQKDILSSYFNYHPVNNPKNAHFVVVQLHKQICCSNRGKIGMVNFATYYNEPAYKSVNEWINKNLTIR